MKPVFGNTPHLRWMLAHPARWIALGLGSGLPRVAPGTWGTLFGWCVFVALDPVLPSGVWAVVIVAGFVLGVWAAHRTGLDLKQPDSGHIVIDEIIAIWCVLWWLPDQLPYALGWQIAAFVLFRVFDIAKPPPVRTLDMRYKNGLGVMLDDIMAALYTGIVLAAGLWATEHFLHRTV